MNVSRRLGYVRRSQKDKDSLSVANQIADLKKFDPSMTIYVDDGVSGERNLSDTDTDWAKLWQDFTSDPEGCQICMVAFDRMGRRKGKVLSYVEDIMDLGGTIYLVWDKKLYDNLNDTTQDIEIMFMSFANEQYRKNVQQKIQRSMDSLKAAGIRLGRKPSFNNLQVAQVQDLHSRGLGYKAIGKVVRTKTKAGKWVNTCPRTIRKIVKGEYVSREQWEKFNQKKREKMLDKNVTVSPDDAKAFERLEQLNKK